MSLCPNAPAAVRRDRTDLGCVGWVIHRDQPIPCSYCWRAAGKPYLLGRKTAQLRRYHLLLTMLAEGRLVGPDGLDVAAAFDDACEAVRRAGVSNQLRDEWVRWLTRSGAPAPVVSA